MDKDRWSRSLGPAHERLHARERREPPRRQPVNFGMTARAGALRANRIEAECDAQAPT